MPRQPRIDSPDLLHHVIVRGIERGKIFRDDDDREDFVQRLRKLLEGTHTDCYAWVLIPNHFHLLLRPHTIELSRLMRSLLTGYAVTFNRRHKRSGHLFQNRYKSIVCEEETYLLELIRYIHLNPLRANQVHDLEELGSYPWCGHAEIMGGKQGCGIATDWVLSLFSQQKQTAQQHYQQFIADGVKQGKRPELVGGGLQRSQCGQPDHEIPEYYDERVLGSSDYVLKLQEEGILDCSQRTQISLQDLEIDITEKYSISPDQLLKRSRTSAAATARIIFCYSAVRHFSHSVTAVGTYLAIGSSSVSRAVQKGELLVREDSALLNWILSLKH